MSRTSVGSIFWGATLVVVGGVLLARNLGYSIPIWGAVARYWPILIIVWGLLKLVDYLRMRNAEQRRPLFSGGEVAMLILVIFAGSAITAAANISPGIGTFFDFDGNFDFWDITGNNYQYSEHHELEATPGSTIRIFNLYGFVDVKPAEGDRIVLDVEKIVRAADKEEADRRAQDFTFSILNEGGTYRIVSNRDANVSDRGIRIGNERQRFKSNLTVKVPQKTLLDVNNRYGNITIEGLEGNQSIINKYGATTIQNVTGAVTLSTGYGNAILGDISGDVNVTNAYASTTLRTVGGNVTVENKYGAVDLQDVKGDANIDNRYSVITVERVSGNALIRGRNNSVDVNGIEGTLDVSTSYKNINVRNVRGAMTVENRHGDVDITFEEPPKNDVTVKAAYGDVTIEVPANSAFTVEGQSRYGEIESEFESLTVSSNRRDRTIQGSQGSGGPRFTVETEHKNIRIEKRG